MRSPLPAAAALLLALGGGAQAGRDLLDDRVGQSIDFAYQAVTGTITDPEVTIHRSTDPVVIDRAIHSEVRRLHAEGDRVLPLVDRLEAMESLYPKTEDLSALEQEREKIQVELGSACSAFVKGTDRLNDMIKARASFGLQAFLAKGFGTESGGYASLVKAHEEHQDLVQVRERVCQVTTLESEAFRRRAAELKALRKWRAQVRWAAGAALLLAGAAAAFALRRRRAAAWQA